MRSSVSIFRRLRVQRHVQIETFAAVGVCALHIHGVAPDVPPSAPDACAL